MRFYTKRKSGGKTPHIRPSPMQNRSESQCSCIELTNRGKCARVGAWVKYALEKVLAFLKSPVKKAVRSKNRRINLILPIQQLTALLLKSFRLRLHCYTIKSAILGWMGGYRDSARLLRESCWLDAEPKYAPSWNWKTLKNYFFMSCALLLPMYAYVKNCCSFLRSF